LLRFAIARRERSHRDVETAEDARRPSVPSRVGAVRKRRGS